MRFEQSSATQKGFTNTIPSTSDAGHRTVASRRRKAPDFPLRLLETRQTIMNQRIVLTLLLAMALTVLGVATAHAQVTAAAAAGRVVDSRGVGIADATVELVHEPSGTRSTTRTDAEGRYSVRGLRVGGPYRVVVRRDGYRPSVRSDQFLQLADTAAIDVTMEESRVMEEMVVTGTRVGGVFDPSRTGTGTIVDRDRIEGLPSISRNIQDYVRTDPRISQVDKERGEISAGGQNTRFNNIRIDGVSTNDAFGLESNNLPTDRQPISIDSIEAINISLVNYDVALAGYTGASIDAVTRSGTNEFEGSVYYIYRDSDWTGKRDGNRFTGFEDESTWGVTFGGPIIRDTLFFFGSYERFTRSSASPIFGPAGSGAGQEVTGISVADINEAQEIAQNVWGFDAGSFDPPGSLDSDIKDLMLKLDWNINDFHRASLRYNRTQQDDPFLRNIGARSLSLSSFWQVSNKEYSSIVGQVYSDWTENLSTEMKLSYAEQEALWDIGDPRPSVRICLNSTSDNCSGADSIWLGSERFRHVNVLETETWNFNLAATYVTGNHELKFGFDYQSQEVFNLFGRDQFGYYEFFGMDAFRDGTPGQYTLFYPTQGGVETRAASWTLDNLGLFLQNTWQARDNLTMTFGVRVDVPIARDDPPFNEAASEFFGVRNDSTIDRNELVQPRFAFNYAPEFERATQIRGGVGLFQGAAANVWLSNPYTNNNVIQGAIFDDDPAAAGIIFSPDPNNQPGERPPPGLGGNIDIVDPSMSQPSVWKANLAVDHELPFFGMIASAEMVFTEVSEAIYYIKPNLGAATGVAPDGRPIYWADPATGSGRGADNRNPDFGVNSTIALPTSKGRGRQLTLSLQGPPDPNWFWNVAYTRTTATEVNPLTSSQAASNWNNSIRADRNANIAENSIYAIRDRFTASINYQRAFFGDLRTSLGVFYEGRSGRPFTYTFTNDANGDLRSGVDPFYVPAGPGDVLFTGGAEMEAAFFDFLDRTSGLRNQQGQIAGINRNRSSFVHQVDLRLAQEIPGIMRGRGEIWLDILNFGNLLNSSWGRIEEIAFPYGAGVAAFAGIDEESGRYIYNFDESNVRDEIIRDDRGESRWALQLGIRYKF